MQSDPTLLALADQVACYRRLSKLAQAQHEHVRQGRTEELLDVLKSRQQVLEQIAAHEAVVAPAKRNWNEYVATLNETDRSLAESLLAETRFLLEQITSADRDDALVLQQRKLSLGKQINQAASARQVHRRYAAAAAYAPPPSRLNVQQ
jgi:hypothetical protein